MKLSWGDLPVPEQGIHPFNRGGLAQRIVDLAVNLKDAGGDFVGRFHIRMIASFDTIVNGAF